MISLYNTLSRKKELFVPTHKNEVRIYSCGPTVYNSVHVGNIRAFLFADTLQRWFRFGEKLETKWVMNITDVDDKTIRDSKIKYPERDPKDALKKFTKYYSDLFFQDLKNINVDKSHFLSNPNATDYIEDIKGLIQRIIDNGFAYVDNGSVYLDVQKYRKNYKYGELVHLDFDNMKSTSRVENDEYEKSSVNDFVLWKGKKEGEPVWDFNLTVSTKNGETVDIVLLPGRPGWHIECSAMSKSLFPDFPFDIHTGGIDLCFPHHEDEICQAQAGYGEKTANYWVHNEHLMVEGKKMSKSLGNFYTLADLEKKGFSSAVVRFFLVTNHYRTKVNLSDESLTASAKMLERIINYQLKINNFHDKKMKKNDEGESLQKKDIDQFVSDFYEAMRDDLNVSVAIAKFYSFMKESGKNGVTDECRQKFVEAVKVVESVFGISFSQQKKEVSQETKILIELRDDARKNKDWEKSDKIRSQLQSLGFEVKDTPEGTVVL